MSWNYNTSLNRVEKHLDAMGEIEVEKLIRDADLNSLLSETTCRDIYGAHVYVDVPNFADLATLTAEGEEYRRVIQALHIYEREVARIVEGSFRSSRVEGAILTGCSLRDGIWFNRAFQLHAVQLQRFAKRSL